MPPQPSDRRQDEDHLDQDDLDQDDLDQDEDELDEDELDQDEDELDEDELDQDEDELDEDELDQDEDELDEDELDEESGPSTGQHWLIPRLGAEAIGTFVLVLAIAGTAAFSNITGVGMLGVALAGGLALTAMVAAVGKYSGAHLNPAVTLGAALAGRLPWLEVLPYWVAQVLGAIGAGAVIKAMTPPTLLTILGMTSTEQFIASTANGYGDKSPLALLAEGQAANAGISEIPSFSLTQAFLIEALVTAALVGVVLAVTRRPNPAAPLAIGATLTVGILLAGLATNAAVNPARATGVAFFAEPWALSQLWLFWLAPLTGALFAGLIAVLVQGDPETADEEEEEEEGWDGTHPEDETD
ncbi:MAG: MIP/aquaporin family protein [Beutenbergiaceae bacterium]